MNLYPLAILCPPPPEPKENSHICVVTPPGSRPIVLDPILSGSGYEEGSGIGSLTHSLFVLEVCMWNIIHFCVLTCLNESLCAYMCVFVCTCVCMYACVCVHMCLCMYYEDIYICHRRGHYLVLEYSTVVTQGQQVNKMDCWNVHYLDNGIKMYRSVKVHNDYNYN